MVLGLKKSRRNPTVNVEYLFRIHEIKPWPPSQSLRNLRSVLVQWEHGERHSGVTSAVVPSLGSGVGDGRIEFSESFRISTTLQRDISVKSGEVDTFLKNCLEFNLYEPRRDKIVKGQLLATAVLDLADYGIIKEVVNISIPMKCTRSFRNTAQPSLSISIHAAEKGNYGGSSSSGDILAKQASMERKSDESVSALTNDEYAEEADTASSFTDDDVSSQSSLATSSIPFDTNSSQDYSKNGSQLGKDAVKSAISFTGLSESTQNGHDSLSVDYEDKGEGINTTKDSVDEKDITEGGEVRVDVLERAKSIGDNLNFSEESVDEISRHDILREREDEKHITTEMKSHVKSVRSSMDIGRGNGSVRNNNFTDAKCSSSNERKDYKTYLTETRTEPSNATKIQKMESRIKMLEGELKEAAVLEASLYSVVAEHGSSMNKVHAPARRLSRYYFHAFKECSPGIGGSAAKSAVSGLVVVAKACGNDVSRLTFWLSNTIVLRAIVTHTLMENRSPLFTQRPGYEIGNHEKISPLKKKESFHSNEIRTSVIIESFKDWDDPSTFISALEKIESWIFSRIIESIWWQTLTPHMQPAAVKVANTISVSDKKQTYGRNSRSGDQQQVNFSLELWKKAFKDACDRLCPLRAGGHECGCLPVLGRLIMEQCIARLDVAMFNAILRESDNELPTDPISDPITDTSVLPIPSGKASFGAGAQLKNGIGNWSRWLTSIFGIDEDEEELKDHNSDGEDEKDSSLKPFHLLNALSDLMMLPKDMLLSRSIRKEVCPTFGAPLIKRVLNNFVPDEFCPDPIPEVVFEALDGEDPQEEFEDDSITNFPCSANPIVYLPPSSSSIGDIIGVTGRSQSMLLRSGSNLMRKSYTSDDELDELHSPLNVIIDSTHASPGPPQGKSGWELRQLNNGSSGYIRYHMLRQVWSSSK